MKEIQSNNPHKLHKWHQKAQGIVEYALILAFIVGIGAAIFAKGGLAEAVSDAYFQISKTIAYALDNTTAGHQRFAQNQLEQGLKNAITSGKVVLGNNAWVEIDLQSELNSDIHANADGGRDGYVTVYGKDYTKFTGLWDTTGLDPSRIALDDADKGSWAGVRIARVGDSNQYTVYYFNGTASKVQNETKGYYTDTNYMQQHFGSGQTPTTWNP